MYNLKQIVVIAQNTINCSYKRVCRSRTHEETDA